MLIIIQALLTSIKLNPQTITQDQNNPTLKDIRVQNILD